MRKKIISLVLMAVLFVTLFNGCSMYKGIDVNAEEFRNGFSLMPHKFDSTGINTKTTFLLKADDNQSLTIDEIKKDFKIDKDVKFSAEESEEGFVITLAKELQKNSLYTFSFKDITWTFQTMSDFSLLGVLPRNESANVPTNSGIEFYFTHEGANVNDFFEISPKVNGKFENHGNVVVFAPKGGLEPKTIYTVTLKKGLKLNKSEQVLEEDYVFSFETASKKNSEYKEPTGYFNFRNIINEFSTLEKPMVPMDYYVYNEKLVSSKISVDVYAYKSMDDFADAISKYNKIPKWSSFAYEQQKIETKGLSKVMNFQQSIDIENHNQKFINLPDKLSGGYYLLDCHFEDITFQTFVQATDLSFYYISSGETNQIM
jgi:hypothetical protein